MKLIYLFRVRIIHIAKCRKGFITDRQITLCVHRGTSFLIDTAGGGTNLPKKGYMSYITSVTLE